MRVAIDIDGVLADFVWGFTQVASDVYGIYPYRTRAQVEWKFSWPEGAVWQQVKSLYNWWMTLEPLVTPQEIDLLNQVAIEHDLYFVTSRPRTRGLSAEQQTRYWLAGIGLAVDRTSVIATKTGTKGALCRALDIEVALDDAPQNLKDLEKHGVEGVIRRWEYNRNHHPAAASVGEFIYRYVDDTWKEPANV